MMQSNMRSAVLQRGRQANHGDPLVDARYKLNDMFCSMWLCHALVALARHKVFDFITSDGTSTTSIAAHLHLNEAMLFRALRAVASNGVLVEMEDGVFGSTPISQLLRSDHPESWRGMALMWGHPTSTRSWEHFSDVLKDGRPGVFHAFGETLYEHLHHDQSATMAFSDAMISNSAQTARSIARAFPFEQHARVVDLAGGVGTMLMGILKEHPHLFGAVLEIPDLKGPAEKVFAEADLVTRAAFLSGDFLEKAPADFDVYLVKNSLWNWGDAECARIMSNVRAAIGSAHKKRFVIIEYVISAENKAWTALYDMQIANLPGGRARTLNEYETLLARAGFELEGVALAQDQTLLIAKPR